MAQLAESVVRLIEALSKLPGIGRKSAERLAYHILRVHRSEALALADAIRTVRENVRYCSHCYVGGAFTLPDISATQMQERVREKMAEMGFPRFLCGFFTRKIPKLERWQPAG